MINISELSPIEFFEYYFSLDEPIGSLRFNSEHTPFDYLGFARKDLESTDDRRSNINAVGNAKRALHLQVETICEGFGYKPKAKDFPPKLNFLRDIGIVAPKVLEKLNKIRNRIEHDYYSPTLDETNDFIDIVELFLYATWSFIVAFPDEAVFLLGDGANEYELHQETGLPIHVKVKVEKDAGKLSIHNHDDGDKVLFTIQIGEENYIQWIRKLFAHLFYLPL